MPGESRESYEWVPCETVAGFDWQLRRYHRGRSEVLACIARGTGIDGKSFWHTLPVCSNECVGPWSDSLMAVAVAVCRRWGLPVSERLKPLLGTLRPRWEDP